MVYSVHPLLRVPQDQVPRRRKRLRDREGIHQHPRHLPAAALLDQLHGHVHHLQLLLRVVLGVGGLPRQLPDSGDHRLQCAGYRMLLDPVHRDVHQHRLLQGHRVFLNHAGHLFGLVSLQERQRVRNQTTLAQ